MGKFHLTGIAILLMHTGLTLTSCPERCSCDYDSAERLNTRCTSGDMHTIPVEQFNLKSEVIVISSPDPYHPNMLTIGPIFAQPKPFSKLEELHIVNSNVPSIGQFSFWGLQNLRVLNLTRNNLTSLLVENFRGLLNLTDLYLDENRISEMPSETFRHLSELRVLSLSDNRIDILVTRLFRMLAKLYHLDLSKNPLGELNPEVFKDIQYVRIFKCRRCQLSYINTQVYHVLSNLEELDIGDNLFTHLKPDEYISLKRLKILKLDGNQLSVIVANMFAQQHSLSTLVISHNRLVMLDKRAFVNLTSLKHLDLSYNKLDRFTPETFVSIIEPLRYLNLSGNTNLHLKEIETILHMLPEINGISIANLSIRQIPTNFFSHNRHLINLNISSNKLVFFPVEMLEQIKFLHRLDISRNKLQGLSDRSLARLWAIPHIDLSGNAWNCERCDIDIMLSYMMTTVLNHTFQNLICQTPRKLKGVRIGELVDQPLEWCSSNSLQNSGSGFTDESRMSVIAGLLLIFFVVITAIAGGICYSKRRTAEYYTNEEKRRPVEHLDNQLVYFCENDNSQHKIPKADAKADDCLLEAGSVATIHAPYQFISKGS